MQRTRAALGFGGANLAVSGFVLFATFRLLPSRWWLIDVGAALVASVLAAAGVGLIGGRGWARRVARWASLFVLLLGALLFAALVVTAAYLSGVYAQVGFTGAVVFGLVALLVLPYLIVFPAAQLLWLAQKKPS